MTTQPDLIPWATFLQMTPAEIEAAFASESVTVIAAGIAKDVRSLLTEETETREEIKTA